MKKSMYLNFVLIIILILSGCSLNKDLPNTLDAKLKDDKTSKEITSLESAADYCSSEENVRYAYVGKGMEYASSGVYNDFIKNNRIQQRVINGGNTLGQVYEVKNGEIRMLKSVEEFYYRDDLTTEEGGKIDVLLKEPLTAGTSWLSASGKKRYIESTDAQVTVPYGTFKTIEVITEDKDGKAHNFYAKGIGIVKIEIEYKDSKVVVELEKITKDIKVDQTVKFYYPEYNKDLIVYKKIKLSLKTNEEVKNYFEKYFKEKPEADASSLISKDTHINKLYLNREENKVYVDFTDSFLKDMNLGAGPETLALQAIANTLGDYYNVDKVQITSAGKNYESGHIIINEKKPIKVKLENVIEIK